MKQDPVFTSQLPTNNVFYRIRLNVATISTLLQPCRLASLLNMRYDLQGLRIASFAQLSMLEVCAAEALRSQDLVESRLDFVQVLFFYARRIQRISKFPKAATDAKFLLHVLFTYVRMNMQ